MKVFLDTNLFLEYIDEREEKALVETIFQWIISKKYKAVVSSGCIYTLTYLVEKSIKRRGIHRPQLTDMIRGILQSVLELATVKNLSHKQYSEAIGDERFTDIEDAFQYHCAMQNGCDVLVTINKRDYEQANSSAMPVLTPREFVDAY